MLAQYAVDTGGGLAAGGAAGFAGVAAGLATAFAAGFGAIAASSLLARSTYAGSVRSDWKRACAAADWFNCR